MTQQQDADLIRELKMEADPDNWRRAGEPYFALLRRAAARLEELTQPAPPALSAEDAEGWQSVVDAAAEGPYSHPENHAVLAVDALLRRRVQRLTRAQVVDICRAQGLSVGMMLDAVMKTARAVEDAHGIGEGAK